VAIAEAAGRIAAAVSAAVEPARKRLKLTRVFSVGALGTDPRRVAPRAVAL
jgi:hypothetical protein